MPTINKKKTVLIAGATGYLGRYLVSEYVSQGDWSVKALARREVDDFPAGVEVVIAEITKPETLLGKLDGVDLIVSSVGITRQRDNLTYRDVDYQANVNLLEEATRAVVPKFAFIHVIKGEVLAAASVGIRAKQDFVDKLQETKGIQSTVICPSGFFSDMQDFVDMADQGRVWLFGDGNYKLNPIHGQDLARATADAIENGTEMLAVGGPDVFTHTQLAELALECLNKDKRQITYLWDGLRKAISCLLPWITPISIYGPAQFFLQAFGMDMVGECKGTRHLREHWMKLVEEKKAAEKHAKPKTA